MRYGDRLKEERKRIGLNQTVFGKIGGVSKTSQLNYEASDRSPDVDYWQAIAEAGADVQYILTGLRSQKATESNDKTDSESVLGLSLEEQLLLERYRNSSQALKDAALRVLLGGETPAPAKFHVKGNVGQNIDGSISGGTFSVDMRNDNKKKE